MPLFSKSPALPARTGTPARAAPVAVRGSRHRSRLRHWGRPVLVFPSEAGPAGDFENNGMVGAVADLIDAGRVKLYCVDSYDSASWSDAASRWRSGRGGTALRVVDPRPGRAVDPRRLRRPAGDRSPLGVSMGAYHAANFALAPRRPVPAGAVLLGQLRPDRVARLGRAGDALYFNNPIAYVANLNGDHLDWLRSRVTSRWCAGRAVGGHHRRAAQHPARSPGCSPTRASRTSWTCGATTSPHDWPWWRRQLAHHLSRMC